MASPEVLSKYATATRKGKEVMKDVQFIKGFQRQLKFHM